MFTSRPLVAILLLHPHYGTAPASWSGAQGHAGPVDPADVRLPSIPNQLHLELSPGSKTQTEQGVEKNIPLLICAERLLGLPLMSPQAAFPTPSHSELECDKDNCSHVLRRS